MQNSRDNGRMSVYDVIRVIEKIAEYSQLSQSVIIKLWMLMKIRIFIRANWKNSSLSVKRRMEYRTLNISRIFACYVYSIFVFASWDSP